jgi:1,4-alpha-glucan branching enzyme
MGGELGQWSEWNNDSSLDWHLLQFAPHRQLGELVARLNELYKAEGALHETDFSSQGFQWIQADASDSNVYAFVRRGINAWREVLVIANLSPVVRHGWRVGVPAGGWWAEVLNTDAAEFGGSDVRNGPQKALREPWDNQPGSLTLTLPPLGVVWLAQVDPPKGETA